MTPLQRADAVLAHTVPYDINYQRCNPIKRHQVNMPGKARGFNLWAAESGENLGPPKGGWSAQQIHLAVASILRLLVINIVTNDCLLSTDSRHEIAQGPKVLADETTPALPLILCNVDRAFPFTVTPA